MIDTKAWFGKREGLIGRGIGLFERLGLIIVLAATLIAGTEELLRMFRVGQVGIPDLLLLFMYLEIVSMVETYWRMGKLPVRMPLYIAIVGIARHLMADPAHQSPWQLVAGATAAVLLSISVLIVRYGHSRFPYDEGDHS